MFSHVKKTFTLEWEVNVWIEVDEDCKMLQIVIKYNFNLKKKLIKEYNSLFSKQAILFSVEKISSKIRQEVFVPWLNAYICLDLHLYKGHLAVHFNFWRTVSG